MRWPPPRSSGSTGGGPLRIAPTTISAAVHEVLDVEPQAVQVSVVLPCYIEVGHVEAEIVRITKAMDGSGYIYDLDVYDDMSTDGTRDLLAKLAPRFPRMRYLP